MSNYSQIVSFGPKDSLPSNNPAKRILGAEIDPELSAIATAIASKLDSANLANEVGTQSILVNTNAPTAQTLGFRGLPVNAQTDAYTAVLADTGRMILHPLGGGAGDVFTIPSNAAVPIGIGLGLMFANLDSNSVTIAIQNDTLTLAGTTSTGSRTLGPNSWAFALKVTTTSWLISGPGLT